MPCIHAYIYIKVPLHDVLLMQSKMPAFVFAAAAAAAAASAASERHFSASLDTFWH